MKGLVYSLSSGVLAAIASACGKFSFSNDEAYWLCSRILDFHSPDSVASARSFCSSISLYVRFAFFVAMIGANTVMWTLFVKALNFSATSVEATVTNTAANFFCTAILGQVFFGEHLSLMWWFGTILIVFGLLLIHEGSKERITTRKNVFNKFKIH
ncbi:Uncharacterised protein g5369 [Pycnogonum litorale]